MLTFLSGGRGERSKTGVGQATAAPKKGSVYPCQTTGVQIGKIADLRSARSVAVAGTVFAASLLSSHPRLSQSGRGSRQPCRFYPRV